MLTRYVGPDEINNFLGERGAAELFQKLATTECHVCKRLFGEHSKEEFNEHALGVAGIEVLGVFPPTPHCLLHFRGHQCTDCAKLRRAENC